MSLFKCLLISNLDFSDFQVFKNLFVYIVLSSVGIISCVLSGVVVIFVKFTEIQHRIWNLNNAVFSNYVATGGCFVEGEWLRNAFRWKESIGPWEERPWHFGDVWMYLTDDGLGYYEFLQVGAMSFFVL